MTKCKELRERASERCDQVGDNYLVFFDWYKFFNQDLKMKWKERKRDRKNIKISPRNVIFMSTYDDKIGFHFIDPLFSNEREREKEKNTVKIWNIIFYSYWFYDQKWYWYELACCLSTLIHFYFIKITIMECSFKHRIITI